MIQITVGGPIVGDQLVAEVTAALGIPVRVTFEPPRTVQLVRHERGADGQPLPFTPGQVTQATALVAAHAPRESEGVQARRFVAGLIGGSVGRRWTDLTANERQALIVAALYRFGALDRDGRVQELDTWL